MGHVDTEGPAGTPDATPEGRGRNPRGAGSGVSKATASWEHSRSETTQLMDAAVERKNMGAALRRVERNKGAAGVDKMTVGELRLYLRVHWPRIKEELLDGRYRPSAVREVMIPKPGGQGLR